MERLTIRKSDFTFPRRGSDAVSVLQCVDRLAAIEDILGDDYDLDRLKVIVNQCMTMREEASQRFSLTANIPIDRLKELVEADRDGRCHIGRCVECAHYQGLAVCEYIGDCGGTNWICGWFEVKEAALDALKGEQDGNNHNQ